MGGGAGEYPCAYLCRYCGLTPGILLMQPDTTWFRRILKNHEPERPRPRRQLGSFCRLLVYFEFAARYASLSVLQRKPSRTSCSSSILQVEASICHNRHACLNVSRSPGISRYSPRTRATTDSNVGMNTSPHQSRSTHLGSENQLSCRNPADSMACIGAGVALSSRRTWTLFRCLPAAY